MAHASDEVPVCRRYGAFPLCENAHVAAKAGSASGCGHYAAGFCKCLEVAEFKRLNPDALGCRYHDAANVRIDLAPLEDFGGDAQVGEPSVGAASDHDLIDRYVPDLI